MCDVHVPNNVDNADADGLYLYRYLDLIHICIVAESFPLTAKTARRNPFYILPTASAAQCDPLYILPTASASAWCYVMYHFRQRWWTVSVFRLQRQHGTIRFTSYLPLLQRGAIRFTSYLPLLQRGAIRFTSYLPLLLLRDVMYRFRQRWWTVSVFGLYDICICIDLHCCRIVPDKITHFP